MTADPSIPLHDILSALSGIREALGEADFDAYRKRRPLRRAVEREIEIISEASRRVPDDLEKTEPDIPWQEIAGSATCCGTTTRSYRIQWFGTSCRRICRRLKLRSDA